MDAFGPYGTVDVEWAKNRPSFWHSRPSGADAFKTSLSGEGPIKETQILEDSRVHYWVVGRDGKAEQGHYILGLGVRAMGSESIS